MKMFFSSIAITFAAVQSIKSLQIPVTETVVLLCFLLLIIILKMENLDVLFCPMKQSLTLWSVWFYISLSGSKKCSQAGTRKLTSFISSNTSMKLLFLALGQSSQKLWLVENCICQLKYQVVRVTTDVTTEHYGAVRKGPIHLEKEFQSHSCLKGRTLY